MRTDEWLDRCGALLAFLELGKHLIEIVGGAAEGFREALLFFRGHGGNGRDQAADRGRDVLNIVEGANEFSGCGHIRAPWRLLDLAALREAPRVTGEPSIVRRAGQFSKGLENDGRGFSQEDAELELGEAESFRTYTS